MNKREKSRFIGRVWNYLQNQMSEAYHNRDEVNFDWYSDGQQCLWCVLNGRAIKIVPRVRSL